MQVSKYQLRIFFDFSKKFSEKQIAMQFIWRGRHRAVSMPLDNLRKTGNVKSPAAFSYAVHAVLSIKILSGWVFGT